MDQQPETNNKEEEEIFKKSYIPTTLEEVIDIERDTLLVEKGEAKKLVYADLLGTGVTSSMQNMNLSDDDSNEEEEEEEEDDDENSESESESEDEDKPKKVRGKKNEDKDKKK